MEPAVRRDPVPEIGVAAIDAPVEDAYPYGRIPRLHEPGAVEIRHAYRIAERELAIREEWIVRKRVQMRENHRPATRKTRL